MLNFMFEASYMFEQQIISFSPNSIMAIIITILVNDNLRSANKLSAKVSSPMPTPPQQARSIATENKMLDVAEQLLRGRDARQVTVENVTKLSGAKVSSFYARFGSIEGFFEALHKRYLDTIYESVLLSELSQYHEQPDLKTSLHFAVKTTFEFGYKRRHSISYFITSGQKGGIEIRRKLIDIISKILKAHIKEVRCTDVRRTAENVTRLIYAMWVQVVLQNPTDFSGRKTSLASVIDTTTEMAYCYLTKE
jgi:AcrR family transcriptional regulator